MLVSRPTPSPLTPVAPLGPLPLGGTLDGVQPSGPDLPLIGNDGSGNLVLAGAARPVSVARLILSNGAGGGLDLPQYTTVQLASITSPRGGRLVWDTTLQVVKVWNGSAYVPVASTTAPPMDIPLAGSRATDWTDGGSEIEVCTFQVSSSVWGARVLRFKATGRVTTGMTGRVRLYNLNPPSGPPSQLAQATFTDTFDTAADVSLGTAPSSQIWAVRIALIGGSTAPDAFIFGGAALGVQAL